MDTAAASSASLLPFIAGGIGSLSAGAACDLLQSELGVTRTRARKILQSIGCAGPAVAMLILAALGEGVVPGVELTRDAAEARLQPIQLCVRKDASPSIRGCNHVHQRLQPCALRGCESVYSEAATLCMQVLFITAIGLASCSAAGFGCGAQDISTRF